MEIKRRLPVSVETGISYQDYGFMQTAHRAPATYRFRDYSWCFSDEQLRKVIAARIAKVACARRIPTTLDELKALDYVAVAQLARCKSAHNRMATESARRAGSLAAYLAALAYRLIRLGEDSVQVAMELGVTPWGIRQTLYRMNKAAQQLEAGTFRLAKALLVPNRRRGQRGWDFKLAIPMREAGASYKEIGARFGIHGQSVYQAFKKAGLIFPAARRARPASHKFPHAEAIRLFAEGATLTELAVRYGVHHTSIWYCVYKSPAAKENGPDSRGA